MADGDLITVDNVKEYLGIQGNTDDSLLARLVSACSAAAASYTSRKILTTVHTFICNGNGRAVLALPQYPVTQVSSVMVGDTVVPASQSMTDSGYVVSGDIIYLRGYEFSHGIQNVKVVYTAGYTTCPLDLAQATVEWVSSVYKRRHRIDEESKNLQGMVVSFSTDSIPKPVKAVLNLYKAVGLTL